MNEVKKIKIFISCPGDIVSELDSIELVVNDLNKTIGRHQSYMLEMLNWKTDTYSQIGVDPQDVINNQMDDRYDILVGIMWLRLGTPTKRDKSGTVEEINRALRSKEKEQLIYFKTEPPLDLTKINPEELQKINSFKKDLSDRGVLFHEFNSMKNFESLFRMQLANLIFDKLLSKQTNLDVSVVINEVEVDKYSHISNLIEEVDNFDEKVLELDIFSSVDIACSHLNLVTNSLNVITEAMTDWTELLNKRTIELTKINYIKDQRLRVSRQETFFNLLANELTDFSTRISNEIPCFSNNFRMVGSSFFNVIFIARKYNYEDLDSILESAHNLKLGSEASLESLALFLKSMIDLPPANFKFNKAKREAEVIIKNLTKETLEGLKLLNETLINSGGII